MSKIVVKPEIVLKREIALKRVFWMWTMGILLHVLPTAAVAEPVDVDTLLPKPHAPLVRFEWLREPDERVVSLSQLERDHLNRQREIVADKAREHGRVITGARSDLETLQRFVDLNVFDQQATVLDQRDEERLYALQALGVVLGDIAATQYDYQWVAFIDARGRTRALRHADTGKIVFPVTAISQRVESGLPVDVRALFKELEPSERPPGT